MSGCRAWLRFALKSLVVRTLAVRSIPLYGTEIFDSTPSSITMLRGPQMRVITPQTTKASRTHIKPAREVSDSVGPSPYSYRIRVAHAHILSHTGTSHKRTSWVGCTTKPVRAFFVGPEIRPRKRREEEPIDGVVRYVLAGRPAWTSIKNLPVPMRPDFCCPDGLLAGRDDLPVYPVMPLGDYRSRRFVEKWWHATRFTVEWINYNASSYDKCQDITSECAIARKKNLTTLTAYVKHWNKNGLDYLQY